MVNKKISIIIPVYGVRNYIEKCARSLFEQTFEEIEYIFVDDASQDDSMSILKSIVAQYPNREVKYVVKKKNEGLPQARKSGVEVASGEYILHVDSDDWIEPDMAEKLYNCAKETNADMVCCGWTEEYADHKEQKIPNAMNLQDYKESVLALEKDAYVWCRLVKRGLYQGLQFPTFNMFEDFAITTQLLDNTHKIAFINRPFYHYDRSNQNSIRTSQSNKRTLTQQIHNIYQVYQREVGKHGEEEKSRILGRMTYAMGWHNVRHHLNNNLTAEENRNIRSGVLKQLPNKTLGFPMYKQIFLKGFYHIHHL